MDDTGRLVGTAIMLGAFMISRAIRSLKPKDDTDEKKKERGEGA